MKKFKILFLIVFAACAATSKFAPTPEELSTLQIKVPGLTYTEAMQGYKLYVGNCSNCHRLHNPKEYTAMEWNKILPEMIEKAKLSDFKQQQLISIYLIAKSK